jgi:putative flippase GtrA
MKTFFKAQFSSLAATFVDFVTTLFLVEILCLSYVPALVCGGIAGAMTNFMINRYWSFRAADRPLKKQGYRYSIVWIGSLVLNVTGTFLLTEAFSMRYIVAKLIVAVVVGLTFNYILQKKYVFAAR